MTCSETNRFRTPLNLVSFRNFDGWFVPGMIVFNRTTPSVSQTTTTLRLLEVRRCCFSGRKSKSFLLTPSLDHMPNMKSMLQLVDYLSMVVMIEFQLFFLPEFWDEEGAPHDEAYLEVIRSVRLARAHVRRMTKIWDSRYFLSLSANPTEEFSLASVADRYLASVGATLMKAILDRPSDKTGISEGLTPTVLLKALDRHFYFPCHDKESMLRKWREEILPHGLSSYLYQGPQYQVNVRSSPLTPVPSLRSSFPLSS